MDLQFQFPLLFRFVITSTITMIIETKHQIRSNSIKLYQASVPVARLPSNCATQAETLRGGRNHTQTAWADQIMALGQPPPSCLAWLLRGRDDVCQYLLGRPRCQAHASESRHSPTALRGRACNANWRREVENQARLHRCKRCRARLRMPQA